MFAMPRRITQKTAEVGVDVERLARLTWKERDEGGMREGGGVSERGSGEVSSMRLKSDRNFLTGELLLLGSNPAIFHASSNPGTALVS